MRWKSFAVIPSISLVLIGFCVGELFCTAQAAVADDVQAVERPALERKIDGGLAVERAPLERNAQQKKADWNVFAKAIERLLIPEKQAIVEDRRQVELADRALRQFLPVLNRVLTIEIHYLRKISNPDPDQLAQIRKAGSEELIVLAREISRNQNGPFRDDEKGVRDRLVDVLLKSAKETLPNDKYERYRDQVQQRQAARVEGACELMTLNIDHALSFKLDDYDRVAQLLVENAKPNWSSNLQTFLYPQNCPLPESSLLEPVLNDRQKKIWTRKSRPNGSINFGWPQNIGIDQLGGGVQLEELDDYSSEVVDE